MTHPLFVSFEGGEACGKSTQANLLVRQLQQAGDRVVLVHEPGTTPLGNQLRRLLKGEMPLSPKAEVLLFVAARAELVSTVLNPTLERGLSVVADRYMDSTVAYQGYGRRLNLDTISLLNELTTEGLKPHLTFLLDIPPEEGLRRSQDRIPLGEEGEVELPSREGEEGQRRFERSSLAFHRRVRQGYLKLAREERERWCILDASQSIEAVATAIWERVQQALNAPG